MPDTSDSTDKSASDNASRRDFLKVTGAATTAGALGSLAGCTGGGGDGGGGGGGGGQQTDESAGDTKQKGASSFFGGDETETEMSDDSSGSSSSDGGGGGESVSISYLSAEAVENSKTKPHFQESISRFEEQMGDVSVSLQTASYGDIKSKLASSVEGGNPPALAEGGSTGLQFYFSGEVPSHQEFVEGSEHFPGKWSQANRDTALFRGDFWCGGSMRHSVSNLGIRPKLFSSAGVDSPDQFETWSGFYDACQALAEENSDVFPYEETGVYNDLESYWGYSHTAYTGGKDPWIRGDPADPTVIINNMDHDDRPRTDGMIQAAVKMANEFSSPESASRGDEEIPSLMLTDKVASFNYATQNYARWYTVKEDAQIGWHDGDGDFMLLPHPKVDPDFGAKIGIPDLEGIEGEHGGHVWALEQAQFVFSGFSDKQTQRAWDLNVFFHRDEQHVLKQYGELYQSIPGDSDMMQLLLQEYPNTPQNFTKVLENLGNYPSQYVTTGAPWDVGGTDQIRWTDINDTISQSIAGQRSAEDTPGVVAERVNKTLSEQNKADMFA
ncbi:MAG: extracellular solute-binding protein [Halobacteriales archaeon]|nr:extracellular solute-binding protein [Halobacteriales archaeon]